MPERLVIPRYCQQCGHFLVERYVPEEGRTRLRCEGCGFVHYMNPRVVAAIIVEHAGRVLLQLRAQEPRAGFWTFPGGFLEVGETVQQGALRETKEEVGLDVDMHGLLGVYTRPDVGIVLVVFEATSATDAAVIGDPESRELGWFAPENIPWDRLGFPTTDAALRDWVAKHAPNGALLDADR
jgi:ADP-ribose pyrophosphatase YjhB (NUDIX family)